MNLINGRALAQKVIKELKQKIAASGLKPGLGVILVGDDPASHLYVKLKEKTCAQVNINFEKKVFPKDASENSIIKTIEQWNNETMKHGILVQLPLPTRLNTNRIISAINPDKDIDGFHPENIRALKSGHPKIEPVLARAIWRLIQEAMKQCNDETVKKTLIIGKSDIFTESLETYLKQKGLKTFHLHPQQCNNETMKQSDIVIVAVGQPNFLRGDDFKDNAIVIDVGINHLPDGQVVGDVDLSSTKQKKGWITPVPGGVGPMTVAMLLENAYELSKKQPLNQLTN